MSGWDDFYECPECDFDACVPDAGDGKILLLGEAPGRDEITQNIPFVGATGEVLRNELAYLGVDIYGMRLANMWLHPPKEKEKGNRTKAHALEVKKQNDKCLAHSVKQALAVAKRCEAILLIGAGTVKYFTGMNVSLVNGLKVKSDMLSAPLIMACVQPATVFHQSVGEFRLTITKFVKELENAKLL